ncbi:MAG: Stp1/IreP family PP2C-type Ser/Thr phosphatase [bacterium]
MKVKAYGATDVGRVRTANEDSFLVNDDHLLYIVADGMGGHQGGDYASSHAVQWIQEEVIKQQEAQESTLPVGGPAEKTPAQTRLLHALKETNRKLFQKASEDPSLRGMGTTVTAVQLDDKYVNIAHVGDSRIYVLREGILFQLSRDHSWVQEQIDAGMLNKQEAENHPLKNIITRSMGHEPDVDVDLMKEEFQPGDKYLLCSDGLSNMVGDETVQKVISEMDIQAAVDELMRMALEAGGLDNTTILVIEIQA